MQMTEQNSEQLPSVGAEISSGPHVFRLLEAIGDGGYGSVFLASDRENRKWAVKAEKYKRSMLHIEVNVLKAANAAGCRHFCQLVAYGAEKPHYTFVVMTLLGKDLHHLRSEMPGKKFSMPTTLRVGKHSLQALEELHSIGFLSRDFKPGNLAPGIGRDRKTIFMYDFGLARKYIDKTGKVLPSRGEVGWRGTQRYGSLNAHLRLDLGRRDDIESWLYMLIEFSRGSLPWRLIQDRGEVHKSKLAARDAQRQSLFDGIPSQFDQMMTLIDSWSFETEPQYAMLMGMVESAMNSLGINGKHRWDWDDDTYSNTTATPRHSPSARDLVALGTNEE